MSETTRRAVLAGAAGFGAAAALAACGSSTTDAGTTTTSTTAAGDAATTGGAATGGAATGISTADIPVNGGKIFAAQKVVVTQPTAGVFKAFSAVCTHQACMVGSVSGGTINCPCHGSKFSATDGSVAHPPATQPLKPVQVTVTGTTITLA